MAEGPEAEEEEPSCPARRCDYREYPYIVEEVSLDFDLAAEHDDTTVATQLRVRPRPGAPPGDAMFLDGRNLRLVGIHIDGTPLREGADYSCSSAGLTVAAPPAAPFVLSTVVRIRPQDNTELLGLYKSAGNFCTQCEADGFRRITYFPDRPDVLAKYTVRITAEKNRYPVLLSNGNLCIEGELDGGRHFATWVDPFPKPSYLFAVVAGTLVRRRDTFRTRSGKDVDLAIWTEPSNAHKTEHAMISLKKSMKWEEEAFGLEYDLGVFNVVAVDDFNCGAMENKGLNIFNSSCVLCDAASSTDDNYRNIEATVAHEYLHNWTGNRVTCRDWFQVSLKEGLTVFREQEFTADMTSRTVKRVTDVSELRAVQFAEDSSAMAHPVRPESVMAIDNFYSPTIYDKGAEVIRMYEAILGPQSFRRGVRRYLELHDGSAATCSDFLKAMADTSAEDRSGSPHVAFKTFERWYSQAGTPRLRVAWEYDPRNQSVTLRCSQTLPETPDWQSSEPKQPQVIPIRLGLLSEAGVELSLQVRDEDCVDVSSKRARTTSAVLVMTEATQTFVISGIGEPPIPSLLRGFSAPVDLELVPALTSKQLAVLLSHDTDEFNRWEAAQVVGKQMVFRALSRRRAATGAAQLEGEFDNDEDRAAIAAYKAVLTSNMDELFVAETLRLPVVDVLIAAEAPEADPLMIYDARQACQHALARELAPEMHERIGTCHVPGPYRYEHRSAAKRALRSYCLQQLTAAGLDTAGLASQAFASAENMTDELGALRALCAVPGADRDAALQAFYDKHRGDKMVLRMWFRIIASSDILDNLQKVRGVMEMSDFDLNNPDAVKAVVFGFSSGVVNFHSKDGSGYKFVADAGLKVDGKNAILAAQSLEPFTHWRKFCEPYRGNMKEQLERLRAAKLSTNASEIISKSLA